MSNQFRFIFKSKIENESYIGCVLESKIHTWQTIEIFTSILEKYNSNRVKITHKANIIILDAPKHEADNFAKELQKIDFNQFI